MIYVFNYYLVSESHFCKILANTKKYKKATKALDLCEICEKGKSAKIKFNEVESGLKNETNVKKVCELKNERAKLVTQINQFEKHYACKIEQRNAYKMQKSNLQPITCCSWF